MLCCIVLHYTALCYIILYYVILYYMLYYVMLCYIMLCYILLFHDIEKRGDTKSVKSVSHTRSSHIHTSTQTYIHVSCMHANILNTCISLKHTYIHTYIHTYLHNDLIRRIRHTPGRRDPQIGQICHSTNNKR
jgi:hypothetical protein